MEKVVSAEACKPKKSQEHFGHPSEFLWSVTVGHTALAQAVVCSSLFAKCGQVMYRLKFI